MPAKEMSSVETRAYLAGREAEHGADVDADVDVDVAAHGDDGAGCAG